MLLAIITGCQKFIKIEKIKAITPEIQDKIAEQPSEPFIGKSLAIDRYIAGFSIENRPVEYLIIGDGEDVILFIAAIHGNEIRGSFLINYMLRYLHNYPDLLKNRKLIIVPAANPDGVANNTRYNARGIDLNRNFLASNRIDSLSFGNSALSEPESRIIRQLIWKYLPDRIISIHEGDDIECIDYDGPAEILAERMAAYCDLSVRKLGARPGSLGSYAGESLKIPTITFELPKDISYLLTPEQLWYFYGNALTALIVFPDYPENYLGFQMDAMGISDTSE